MHIFLSFMRYKFKKLDCGLGEPLKRRGKGREGRGRRRSLSGKTGKTVERGEKREREGTTQSVTQVSKRVNDRIVRKIERRLWNHFGSFFGVSE